MKIIITLLLSTTIIVSLINASIINEECNLEQHIQNEIAGYQHLVNDIIENVIRGPYKGSTYEELSRFIDIFGHRFAGSENLENAIDYMLKLSQNYHLENVHGEDVKIPYWTRGYETAIMLTPRKKIIPIIGLGYSVATLNDDITADIVVVRSFDELEQLKDKVKNKIVVYNQNYTTYGESVKYRSQGASRASKYGALATLIRSITPFSLRTLHTGMQSYESSIKPIPTACITVEDAEMLYRRYRHGENVTIQLIMKDGLRNETKTSRNTIVDITGTTIPNSTVIVSGHLDSWDVGEGAMDDGGGAFISWNALAILKRMNLRPKRTLRAILWTGEEMGLIGVQEYAKIHKHDNITFVMESDEGTFKPNGIEYTGSKKGGCIVKEILKLFRSINTTQFKQSDFVGSDIIVLTAKGIPGASLLNQNAKYFWYHHTEADTLSVLNTNELDLCTALWTAFSYIIADLSFDMPK